MATKISTILDKIDNGSIALPVFQRGYVWTRKQVRELFTSLYKDFPVGSLLIWETASSNVKTRGGLESPATPLQILLDGQQRMTSLYGVMRGKAPAFFDGNTSAFNDLRFHLEDEVFEFHQPLRMSNDPLWIDVSSLYQKKWKGVEPINRALAEAGIDYSQYGDHIGKLLNIENHQIHEDHITGDDKTIDVVIEIFDRVNSGGTKLTPADLALAKICADLPDARELMFSKLNKWQNSGYNFKKEWLLRVINVLVTGEARFVYLHNVDSEMFQDGLKRAEKYVDKSLNMISGSIGLDHTQVLFAQGAIPLIIFFLDKYDGNITPEQRDKLLYWYVHSGMWGRYSAASEGMLNQDLSIIQNIDSPQESIETLIEQSRLAGHLRDVEPYHFLGARKSARFYSIMYMLTRMSEARDFGDGLLLRKHQLGKMAQLELHHIFPKSQLKKRDHSVNEINALANYCFLTKESNSSIRNKLPADYLAKVAETYPGVLESQWIPTDPNLWKIDNYTKFLSARRELLAQATDKMLKNLLSGSARFPDETVWDKSINYAAIRHRPASIVDDEEELLLNEINEWMTEMELPVGIMGYELADEHTGEQVAMFDLAWPDGVQSELSQPVAVLIDEGREVLAAAGRNGYRFFTSTEGFKKYITEEILITTNGNSIQAIVEEGESEKVEFKSTLRVNLHINKIDKALEHSVIKTIAGFLNHDGGTLLIGIADDGSPLGIEVDKFKSEDKMKLHLTNLVDSRIDPTVMTNIRIEYETYQDHRIMKVICRPSPFPVYVKDGDTERFYLRTGPATKEIPVSKVHKYIKHRFNQ